MEFLLSILPKVFCLWTGILIAWGVFDTYQTSVLLHEVKSMKRIFRTSDVVQLIITAIGTVLLFIALFITPKFVAFHMDTILFLEILYSLFLVYAYETSNRSMEPIHQVKLLLHK